MNCTGQKYIHTYEERNYCKPTGFIESVNVLWSLGNLLAIKIEWPAIHIHKYVVTTRVTRVCTRLNGDDKRILSLILRTKN